MMVEVQRACRRLLGNPQAQLRVELCSWAEQMG